MAKKPKKRRKRTLLGQIKKQRENRKDTREKRRALREERKRKRIAARDVRKTAKISKKTAEKLQKIYGDMTPEEVNQLNELQPLTAAMNEQLTEKGISVENENDPIEVATKFAMTEETIDDPMDTDTYNEAFYDDEETFESVDKYNKRKQAVKSVLTGLVAGISDYAESSADKQRAGIPLSKSEQAILDAKESATDIGKQSFISDNMNKIVILLVVVIIALFVFKKK